MSPHNLHLPVLKKYYQDVVISKLMKILKLTNIMSVPKISKIVVSSSSGKIAKDSRKLGETMEALKVITGRHPQISVVKQPIATFGIRQGQALGAKVTLRGQIIYEFLFNLINVDLPGSKIQALPLKCDGHGNYSFGVSEHIMFKAVRNFQERIGLNITFSITSGIKSNSPKLCECSGSTLDVATICLLRLLGMPIQVRALDDICPIGGLHTQE